MLMDIATEELSQFEAIGSVVVMPNKRAKGKFVEVTEEEGELYRSIMAGDNGHVTQVL
ncbi:manganese catalase family protein [Azoarcus indigens]|uniref:Manganese containing catalase n=1 Tax=Azoarcus indigens TaxID=29545 RepID=A0A4V3BKX5_9RHOO|nr:manganese catalase family protein [Azoarcus indigens]TDN44512.1 manganese containing catalase [Azoarcus indigens]